MTTGYPQATYTKIFLQFPQKFWFDTEVGVVPVTIMPTDDIAL
jgi:hypothetical protein